MNGFIISWCGCCLFTTVNYQMSNNSTGQSVLYFIYFHILNWQPCLTCGSSMSILYTVQCMEFITLRFLIIWMWHYYSCLFWESVWEIVNVHIVMCSLYTVVSCLMSWCPDIALLKHLKCFYWECRPHFQHKSGF